MGSKLRSCMYVSVCFPLAEFVNVMDALKIPGLRDYRGPFTARAARALYKLGEAVHQQCQYPLAKLLLQHALALAYLSEAAGAGNEQIKQRAWRCVVQNHLARVLMAEGDLGQAEALARSALDSARSALAQVQPEGRESALLQADCQRVMMMTSTTLGNLYGYKGELEAARDVFLSMMESIPETDDSMASLQVDLAKVYLQVGLLDKAEKLLRSALKLCSSRPPDDPDKAEILVFLAHVLMQRFEQTGQQKHWKEAFAKATTAHRILDNARSAHMSLYPFCVSTLAHLDRQRGLMDRALKAHKDVLALYEKTHGPFSVEAAGSLEAIALCLEIKPDGLVEAEGRRRRGLDIRQQHMLGPEHITVAHSLQSLARNLARQGTPDKLEEAEARAVQAVQTMCAATGARNQQVVSCLETLYSILKKRSKHRAALRVWLGMRKMQARMHPWRCLAASATVAAACGGAGWLLCRKGSPAASCAGRLDGRQAH